MSRRQGETCATCEHAFKDIEDELECRRNPPTIVTRTFISSDWSRDSEALVSVDGDTKVSSEFPDVKPFLWCGEWKMAKEEVS